MGGSKMEEHTLVSREIVEGHIVETRTAENEAGFGVTFIEIDNVEIDYDALPDPGTAEN